jgi:flagellar biogenesis protein FliO
MEALVNLAGGAWVGAARVQPRRMKVLETLSMGPKRQLVLVCCDGEKYLVGTGPESVQTIVRIEPRASGLSVVPAEWGERP